MGTSSLQSASADHGGEATGRPARDPKGRSAMFLHSFNYFRGIAILIIVAGHCLYMSGWEIDSVADKWLANLVLGGTTLFVFISGFLFHHIYAARFTYRKFMATKIKNVLTPYLVLSGPLVLYSVLIKGGGPYAEYIFPPQSRGLADAVQAIIFYLWTGRILEAYWYIPFIMVVFAGSPLVLCFIRLRPTARFLLVGGLFIIALFVQRPVLNLSVLQSVVYFLPVYLFGILVSLHRETVYQYLTGRELHLLLVIVLLALVQAVYYPSFGNLHKQPWVLSLPDLLLVQKILLCLFFTVLLNRLENKTIPFLGTLASASFAIYFIHPYLLWGVQLILDRRYPLLLQLQGPALWLVMTPVVLLVSLGIALGVRRVFKSYSRVVIGW